MKPCNANSGGAELVRNIAQELAPNLLELLQLGNVQVHPVHHFIDRRCHKTNLVVRADVDMSVEVPLADCGNALSNCGDGANDPAGDDHTYDANEYEADQ